MAKKEEKALETVLTAGALAEISLFEDMAKDSIEDSGFDNLNQGDLALPFVMIVQATSPKMQTIPGITTGDLFNTVTNEILKKSIQVIPCSYRMAWVEWKPRTGGKGGFVKDHPTDEILKQCTIGPKGENFLPNGNVVVPTAYHYCVLVKEGGITEPIVLSFSSTQLKKSRKWNTQMMSLTMVLGDKKVRMPRYGNIYTVKTVPESNAFGQWMGFEIGNPERITDTGLYREAKRVHTDVESGAVKADHGSLDGAEAPAVDTSNDANVL